jgi:hypothetical protein
LLKLSVPPAAYSLADLTIPVLTSKTPKELDISDVEKTIRRDPSVLN